MSVPSPCINVCHMNPETGCCEGCFRTLPEIAEWGRTDDAQKRAILAAVAVRRAAAAPAESRTRGECMGEA